MVFNSYTFIAFFVVVLILHNLPLSWKVKKINLLLASYVFYAAWNPPFILLLWLSTVVDYFVGRSLYVQTDKYKRRVLLVVSLIGNLGMLCFFKYGTFILDNFVQLVHVMGIRYQPAKPNIILPAGISFYTFTTLCYTIDMYKREGSPVRSLLDFSLFVTFFPHLVAGPIVRPVQLVPQFDSPRTASRKQLMEGLFLLTVGLFMKTVLADGMLAGTADVVFNARGSLPALDAWAGALAFSGQIFFDFAGYSTCAIGVALCLGFVLPQNFRFPYAATSFSDFWRRWHITLSLWLRDYLYVPLGGNRKGRVRTYVNLMITMLIGGLWHGANWTFVAWGGLHGTYLCIERFLRERREQLDRREQREQKKPRLFYAFFIFCCVVVTWVFFRSATFAQAGHLLASMSGSAHGAHPLLTTLAMVKVGVVVSALLLTQWLLRNTSLTAVAYRLPWWLAGLAWSCMMILIFLGQESTGSFIYFQF